MSSRSIRRHLPTLVALAVAGVIVGVLVARSHTTVTRARLERALPPTFARLYVQQAAILGHRGITVQSLHARAQCDKGGPKVADQGPGNNWICLMSWHDPNIDQTVLPGKFEVNVHTNDCYTAGGPSKIVGLATITDARGNDATNPVFEFDGCFDPHGTNRPTGVVFPTTTTTTTGASTTTPAALTLPRAAVPSNRAGRVNVELSCSAGVGGCAGTITAGSHAGAPRAQYVIAAGKTSVVTFPMPAGASTLDVRVAPVIGTAPALTTLAVTTR